MKQFIVLILFSLSLINLKAQDEVYICTDDNELWLVDLNTCGHTQLGYMSTISNNLMFDIAINPLDSQMYGVTGDNLYRIDRFTGATTLVGPLNLSGRRDQMNALTFGSDGTLYGAVPVSNGSNIYTINTTTGAATLLGTVVLVANSHYLQSSGDLTFYQGELYLSAGYTERGSGIPKSHLVKIDLTDVTLSTDEGEFNNLAEIFGVTTVGCPQTMYAFQENNIYKLPPSNLLQPTISCPTIVPDRLIFDNTGGIIGTAPRIIFGAASITESLPEVDLGPDTTLSGCIGNSLLLDAFMPSATGYLWNDNSTNPTLTVTTSGTYWVEVTQGNCSTYDTINVVFTEITSSVDPSTVCNDGCAQLNTTINTTPPCCDYSIVIAQSPIYGTTEINILVDGVHTNNGTPYKPSVTKEATYYFRVCDGASIDATIGMPDGSNISRRHEYSIYDADGNLIFQDGIGSNNVPVGGHIATGSCASPFNYSYTWSPNTGLDDPSIANPMACGISSGTSYVVSVEDLNQPGCIMEDTLEVPYPCTPCVMDSIPFTTTGCYGTSLFDAAGTVYFTDAPTGGTLTITYDNGSSTHDTTINAPFNSPENWSISGIPADGSNYTITGVFSSHPTCTFTVNGTAPVSCSACTVQITDTTITNMSCLNSCDGSITITTTGGATEFSIDNGATFSANNVFNGLCAGNYTVIAKDGACADTVIVSLTTPTGFTFTTDSQNSNCGLPDGYATVLNFTGGSPTYTYDWGTGATPNDTLFNLVPGSYNVVVADNNGCDTTITITVGNNVVFTASIAASTNTTCYGDTDGSATVTTSDPAATYTYSWNTAPVQTTATATGLTGGTYICTVTDVNTNCTDTAGVTITAPAELIVTASSDTTICDGTNTTITANATGGDNNYTYTWNQGLGARQNHLVTPTASTSYIVTVTDGNSCTAEDTVEVTVNLPISIPNTLTHPSCIRSQDGQIILTPQGGTAPYSYLWDNAANNQTTNLATNLGAGSYSVRITDATNCFVDSSFLLVDPTPFTYTTATQNSNCSSPDGYAAVLNFSGGSPTYTYNWGTGATTNDTLFNLLPGSYNVVVTDNNGCDTNVTITVGNNTSFTASIIASNNPLCFNSFDGSATATGSDPTATYSYSWNTSPIQATATATGLTGGTYICTVTDINTGCTDTTGVILTTPSELIVTASPDLTVCNGDSANITANATGGDNSYTYSWDQGLGTGQGHLVSPTTLTTYTVTATDGNGCKANDNVSININPPLNIVTSNNVTICPGTTANLSAIASNGNGGPYSYNWSNGINTPTQTVSPTVTTTYVVTVDDGCSVPITDTVVITINTIPGIDFIVNTNTACLSDNQTFEFYNTTSTIGGIATWNFGDGTTATGDTVTHRYANPGKYNITMTITFSSGGCANTLTKKEYVTVFANPTADFISDPNPASMFNPTVYFYDQSYINIVTWNWNIGGLDSSIIQNPTYTFPSDSGSYPVTLTVTDGNGCMNNITKRIVIKGEYGIYVPNAFTPDGDGLNEGFFPNGFGISTEGYQFVIYNRWGELLFESNERFQPWDGTYQGVPVPNDTYVWKLHFKDINGVQHNEIGKVTIVK